MESRWPDRACQYRQCEWQRPGRVKRVADQEEVPRTWDALPPTNQQSRAADVDWDLTSQRDRVGNQLAALRPKPGRHIRSYPREVDLRQGSRQGQNGKEEGPGRKCWVEEARPTACNYEKVRFCWASGTRRRSRYPSQERGSQKLKGTFANKSNDYSASVGWRIEKVRASLCKCRLARGIWIWMQWLIFVTA